MREALVQFGLDPEHIGAAARAPRELLAYVELHIEQGPVLEQQNLAVGVVTAIAGAPRLAAKLTGMAGHAGTVRWRCAAMRWRALPNAFAWWKNSADDEAGLVGTVGYIDRDARRHQCDPRHVSFTLDLRAPTDPHRKMAVADIVRRIEAIAKAPQSRTSARRHPRKPHRALRALAEGAGRGSRRRGGYGVFELPSGAGHDGMAMIDIADVAMIFVRCRGGISHNPAEHVEPADADAGARVLLRLVENFRPREGIEVRGQ